MKHEVRRAEVRATNGDKPGVTLKVIRSGVVDEYGSLWKADAFDESLGVRLPTLVWHHNWEEPLGPAVGFRAGADGPEVDFHFSDFEAVPMARRAHAQVSDGTIRDASVGFVVPKGGRREPTDDEIRMFPGVREVIEKADADEVSLVLRGAVPGAKVLAVRSGRSVDFDAVVELARRKVAGEISEDEAKAALELLGEDAEGIDDDDKGDPKPTAEELAAAAAADDAEVDALLDDALAVLDRSRQR